MYLLGIDTSGKQGSVALARGDADTFQVLGVASLTGGAFSAQLVPQIADLLAQLGLGRLDIGGLAAASGPGSFTGLRVGLAAVKGLAEVLQVPIAVVSVLEALAAEDGREGKVVAALDAGRGEVFAAEFEVSGGTARLCQQCLFTPEELASVLAVAPRQVVTPDARLAESLKQRGVPVREATRPGSEVIARLGLKKILAGQTVTPEQLDADYIRRSDAEIVQGRKNAE